ncbi:MAG: hypothetical protein EBS01_12595 [Verrucomicrobia bacterium]|nr:hypothetical protein [Verrucomicrobiota bacterium]
MRTMDRMREELFARSFNLLTTKSQVLRVYVIGQALGRTSNALATSLLEATVELRQDAAGQWQPDIVMQK